MELKNWEQIECIEFKQMIYFTTTVSLMNNQCFKSQAELKDSNS